MSTEDSPTPPIRVGDEMYKRGDHFYEDGNILILVQDTAFCVHRGVLAHHSEVFAFPPAGPKQIVGMVGDNEVPSMQLEEDPHHFTSFLNLILPRGENPVSPQNMPLILVEPLVRTASKYCADSLLVRLYNGLNTRLPDSAETLTKLDIYATPSDTFSVIRAGPDRPELAKCLPLAYYALATVEWSKELWDSTDITPLERFKRDTGRARLLLSFGETSYQLTAEDCSNCSLGRPHGWINGKRIWRNLLTHPFETITTLLNIVRDSNFCGHANPHRYNCAGKYKTRLENMRETILEALPMYFDLPPASS